MNTDTLRHIAKLARISVPKDEEESLRESIEGIVHFIDRIQQVDVSDQNTSQSDRVNIFREDEVTTIKTAHNLVEAAPKHRDDFVEVPKVIE